MDNEKFHKDFERAGYKALDVIDKMKMPITLTTHFIVTEVEIGNEKLQVQVSVTRDKSRFLE